MRSILVQAGRDAGMGARLDTAMDLARVHGGHLTVLVDTPVDKYVTVDPYGGAILAREALETALKEDDARDGGGEAARAMKAAVPLLAQAADVRVLTVASDKADGFPPTEALRYLSRHGIKAELTELARGNSVEETLAAEVARVGAELLVMGAYSHSRLREFLFGGVTRFFLDELTAPPLLIAH